MILITPNALNLVTSFSRWYDQFVISIEHYISDHERYHKNIFLIGVIAMKFENIEKIWKVNKIDKMMDQIILIN